MLRTEFPFPVERWPQRLLAGLVGEPFMGFLAIISVGLTLFPMLFDLKPAAAAGIDTLQWGIIAWFAFEYIFAFASSRAKSQFLVNPWRLLDLATVLIPLATLLPGVSNALRSSPVLRLVRLGRLITLGVRVSGVAIRQRSLRPAESAVATPFHITRMAGAPDFAPAPASWDELLRWLRSPGAEWFQVTNPAPEQLAAMGGALGLPGGLLENHLFGTSYPHLDVIREYIALFVWVPEMTASGHVEREGVLFLQWGDSLLSLARRGGHEIDPFAAPAAAEAVEETPFALRMLGHVLERVMEQNENVVGQFEQEVRNLEDLPIRESSPAFFERTFRLKRELSAAQADLWRLKGVLAELAEGRIALPGVTAAVTDLLRRVRTDAEYLYETIINARDDVVSVLELHLNIVSFDMNRVMRVLAVVSVLGLIPAVIGGLFGMNLIDNPWPFTLPQVGFTVCFGMVLCLYLFFVKGWLR